jgi:cytochrome P450
MPESYIAVDASSLPLMKFDPFGMDFRSDPAAFHPLLFETSPGFILMEGDVPSAFAAKYRHVADILRDFRAFSSLKPEGLPGMQRIDFFNSLPVMNYSDPPDHTRRRKVVNPAFTPKRTEKLLEEAASFADKLLDGLLPSRKMEVIGEFAKPLSIDTLLRRFMAIEDKDQHIFLNYVKTLPLLDRLKLGDPKPQPYLDAWEAGKAYCKEQQELAKRGECTNLIGVIAGSAEDGAISDDEMMAMMIVLLIGGVSTMAGAIGTALMNLARSPGLVQRIRSEPQLANNHLEESLRLDPPVSLVLRFAVKDTKIGDAVIPAGMPVYVMIAAACHDQEVFPDPYKFDVDRANAKDHFAFGYGIHTCIGNAITRVIVPMLIRKLAERAPDLRLLDGDGGIVWNFDTPRARHLEKLNLSL